MADKPKKRYVVHCDPCGKNVIISQSEDVEGLYQYKVAQTPGGVPVYDTGKKEIIAKKNLQRRKMFRCPNCGRGIVVRAFLTPISELTKDEEKKNEQEDLDTRR